jgi:hypothetical protein
LIGTILFLVAGAYRVGWEAIIFLLVFVALWRLAGNS